MLKSMDVPVVSNLTKLEGVFLLRILGAFFCLLVSCQEFKKGDSFEDYFSAIKEIQLERIQFEVADGSPFFRNMYILGYIDSVVVVNEYLTNDYTFKLIDLKTGAVKNFGKRGEGPNELVAEGGYFLTDYQNNQLIIGDGLFNYTYSVEDLFKENPQPLNSFTFETNGDRFIGARVFAKGKVIGSTYLHQFASYTLATKQFETHGDYPGGESQSLAHQAYYCAHPTEAKIAYGVRAYPEFGILTEKDDKLQIQKWNWGEDFIQVEELSDGTRSAVGLLDEELNFFSSSGSKSSIFFLFSGKKVRQADGQIRKSGLLPSQVYQLDWEGNPQAILNLGQPVKAIAVDPDGQLLFASSAARDPELLIYKLPSNEN
ncbi:hypothetical protein [Algoriphagus formosus]|uniref:hypothetical protein n=1 Tax=Algoriphagus formosus TaxID=2007308 RepID=UPI0018E225C0|nr:hypothetical protein [Algoriphagus formosus]